MNRKQLVSRMAIISGITQLSCSKALSAFIATVKESYRKKETVTLTGFGTFGPLQKKERIGINPITREKIKIPTKCVLRFKNSKTSKL